MLPFDTEAALEVVREAAVMALALQGRCKVEVKPDNTFVTEADRKLEAFLHERLGTLAPDYSFLGEETGLTGDPAAPTWVIDPIDGTNNFVRDVPLWTISVGLVHEGRVLFGIVAVPPLGEIYWAVQGQGAWGEQGGERRPLQARDIEVLVQEDLVAANTEVERVTDFSRMHGSQRNFGSVAYHMVLLAKGSLCATLACQHKLYDIAGGMCLCVEAGCGAHYLDGRAWVADVTEERCVVPLLVAPPGAMRLVEEKLSLRTRGVVA